MPSAAKIDPIGHVAAAVVAGDDDLRRRVKRLVNALLADAEHTVRFGTPSERNQLMRMVVPALLKSLQGADVNAGEAAQSEAYHRMLDMMRGDGGAGSA